MPQINLIPSDLVPKKSVIKLSRTLVKLTYGSVAVFLVLVITVLSIFVINTFKIDDLKSEVETLSNSVKEYENTEQQIVLAKDRMSKMKEIWKTATVNKHIFALENILPNVVDQIELSELNITPSKSEITLQSRSSLAMSNFMASLISSQLYNNIVLKNLSFNPNFGYRITFDGIIK